MTKRILALLLALLLPAAACADETGRFEDKPYRISLGVGQAFTCGYRMRIL